MLEVSANLHILLRLKHFGLASEHLVCDAQIAGLLLAVPEMRRILECRVLCCSIMPSCCTVQGGHCSPDTGRIFFASHSLWPCLAQLVGPDRRCAESSRARQVPPVQICGVRLGIAVSIGQQSSFFFCSERTVCMLLALFRWLAKCSHVGSRNTQLKAAHTCQVPHTAPAHVELLQQSLGRSWHGAAAW
jgi:hypothetical protein